MAKRATALANFLKSPAANSRSPYHTCSICRRADVKAAVDEFWAAREAGATASFRAFGERFVALSFKNPPGLTALRTHTLRCLGRDITTGEKITL